MLIFIFVKVGMSQTWSLPATLTMVAVGRWFLLLKNNIILMVEFKATICRRYVPNVIHSLIYFRGSIFTSTWGNGPVWLIFFKRVVQSPTSHIIWMATAIWMKSLPDGKKKTHALWEAMEGHWSLDTQVFVNEAWWPWPCSRDGVWKHGKHTDVIIIFFCLTRR